MIDYDNLRPWQKRFADKFSAWRDDNFLLVALPGGGKTFAALYVSRDWIRNAGARRRSVVVVVPTRALKRQWQKEARKRFGLDLQTKEFDGALKSEMHGIVITYAGVASCPEAFSALCARGDVFAIFDEPHHMSDDGAGLSWGSAAKEAFSGASRRLFMSGTPWRSDGTAIPFLARDAVTGDYEIHERFDWPTALEEDPQAIRYLSFRPFHGSARFERDGGVFTLNTREDMSPDDEAKCLRGVLYEELFIRDIVKAAHEKLCAIRQEKADAGGLVVCMDIAHAQKVAGILQHVTGVRPFLIVSDDEIAGGDSVDSFQSDRGIWIVSVRQVSEGVDLPRLMVGVYLTNYVTELFFRQFVGRVARHQRTEEDREAHIYMPHHSRLVEYAEKIKELQAIALRNRQGDEDGEGCGDGRGVGVSSTIYLGGSNAEGAGVIIPGMDAFSPIAESEIVAFARRYRITETQAAQILEDRRAAGGGARSEPEDSGRDDDDIPLEELLDRKRRNNARRCRYWAHLSQREHRTCEYEANSAVSCASVVTATSDQLDRRLAYIERQILEAKQRGA